MLRIFFHLYPNNVHYQHEQIMKTARPDDALADKMEAILHAYDGLTNKIISQKDASLEIDISTPFYPDQVMLIDRVDYETLLSPDMGRITARAASSPIQGIVATVNTKTAGKKFKLSSTYVHSLLCEGRGYLWHKNGNMLDNRRENLETDIPLQTSTVGLKSPGSDLISHGNKPHVFIDLLSSQPTSTLEFK